MKRLAIALGVYVVLGIVAWTSLSDSRIRLATVAILGLFAVKTLLHRHDVLPRDNDHDLHEPM